ncbi:MAG: peptide chain release factor N(5)-glutamine methyltransferase [Candidatus Eisenbacteria bacterium]|nr:peptide chain release factor N(5)-glutamine methyltransferase [Candidatus Eisenbacteria bacterium]
MDFPPSGKKRPAPLERAIEEAARPLIDIRAGNPRFEAELLLAHALARPRAFLFTHPEYRPSEKEEAAFAHLLGRRLSGEPLQYVLGTAAFRHLTLRVGPGVLIPRSETEVLVGIAWQALQARLRLDQAARDRGASDSHGGQASTSGAREREIPSREERPWVIDVGVGSGAILLALLDEERRSPGSEAVRPPRFRALGIDPSPVAMRYARENALANGLPAPQLVRAGVLAPISASDPPAPVIGIVSNPPYISTAEMAELPVEIREHEPALALHGGDDGLSVIRELLDQSLAFLGRGAFLCFEMGAGQEEAVRAELERRGLLGRATIHPDLAGRPRVVFVNPA